MKFEALKSLYIGLRCLRCFNAIISVDNFVEFFS